MKDSSRRSFIKNVAAASAAVALVPQSVWANSLGANEKVNLACVGIGFRGADIIKEFAATGLANVVALCDVDMGAEHTQEIMNMFPKAKRFRDFRQMFDKMANEIDAVSIGTPDHSHFCIAMHAIKLGKHIYVEKPLTRTFFENELLLEAARKYPSVVTQMGNQGHSGENYFQFKAWKDAGIIKDVTAISAHMNSKRRWHDWDTNIKAMPAGEPIPKDMDWDVWLGSAPYRDYNKDFHKGQWRCWYDYGMGALGDWGAHIIDTAHEFLELGLPEEVNCLRADGHNPFFFPKSSTIEFKFAKRKTMPACTITWYDGLDNLPPIPDGYGVSGLDPSIPPPSTGALEPVKLNPGKIIYGKDLTFKGGSHSSTLSIIPESKAKDMKLPEYQKPPSNHFANFLLACTGKEKARSPFEVSVPLSQVFNLGVISQQLNTKLKFDMKKKQITNNAAANALLKGFKPRAGWEQYYKA